MSWQGIQWLPKFVSGSKITGSGSSSGKSMSPDLGVVDPAVKTGELPVGKSSALLQWSVLTDKAKQSAGGALMAVMRGDEQPQIYPV